MGRGPGPAGQASSTAKHAAPATLSTNVARHTPTRASAARFSDSAAATYSRLLANGNSRCSGSSAAAAAAAAVAANTAGMGSGGW